MRTRLLPIALALVLMSAVFASSALKPIPLIKATTPMLDSAHIKVICKAVSKQCKAGMITAYVPRTDGMVDVAFLISDGARLLVELHRSAADQYVATNHWDFGEFEHSALPNDGVALDETLSIYPALYPVGKGTYAIAVVSHAYQMFSGGGSGTDLADFIRLGANGQWSRYADSIPFACSSAIRACFSEKEYRYSKHCEDYISGYLSMKISNNYDWHLTWVTYSWPSYTPKSKALTTRTPINVELNKDGSIQAGEVPDMCESQE